MPWVPCRKILRHVKNPAECEKDTSSEKFTATSRQISPALLPGVSAGFCQRAVGDESVMNITQMSNAQ
jgi:hypothetical protein